MSAAATILLAACGGDDSDRSGVSADQSGEGRPDAPMPADTVTVASTIEVDEHRARRCTGAFTSLDLDHVTQPRGAVMAMVDGTGAGVLLDDLDDDGRLDIVLPNLSGETSIFWNETEPDGDIEFERGVLDTGRFRQAIAADVDGDGDRDVLLTTGIGPPIAYLSQAESGDVRSFRRTEYRTRVVAFSVAPGDLDGDGSIEVVTGSYNAELTQNRDPRVLNGVDIGVAVTRPTADTLATGVDTEFLTESAQALATMIVDLDGDGLDDVVVGNDLGTPDRIWLGDPRGLTVTELFDVTSLSTMSLDVVDIDHDGTRDLVSTDMKPMDGESRDAWAPIEDDIEAARVDQIQQPRNVVQLGDGSRWNEVGVELGVDATSWSWSGLFGDLDDDGLADLYVVNGMQAVGVFDTLPDAELVAANQAFRNTGDTIEPRPDWGLAATDGGRGMAQGDLDGDGDLDVVVNDLGAPSTVFVNGLCGADGDTMHTSVIVEPIWSSTQNLEALATEVRVDDGDVVRAVPITGARGYISTSASQAHVGLGPSGDAGPVTVTVRWPDGAVTVLDDVEPGTTTRVERTEPAVTAATDRSAP
ncbi:MAG: FG-GAP-like repeat-containing protein [Actinomycetota bacterium]